MTKLHLVWEKKTYVLEGLPAIPGNQDLAIDVRVVKNIHNKVYTAHLGPEETDPFTVICKLGRGSHNIKSLEKEHHFYMQDLAHLQGTVIPRCYGFYKAMVDDVPIGCLLLEYCTGKEVNKKNDDEYNRLVMLAICKIHQVNIEHGNLIHYDSGRHIVMSGSSPRIVDFSQAKRHDCLNCAPHKSTGRVPDGLPTSAWCSELSGMEREYGMRTVDRTETIEKAGRWPGMDDDEWITIEQTHL
ncbi:hypothetical protein BDZ97DRAFT_1665993 [Flammula alnicola]|nr:hypothetical protein BDZ97DRAFT_1665993 [Flammula alnicola]